LDLKYYDETERYLSGNGFTLIGNYESGDFKTKYPNKPILLRILVSDDGFTLATIYILYDATNKLSLLLLDFQTEFNDNSFMITSRSTDSSKTLFPHSIKNVFAPSASNSELLELHKSRIGAYGSNNNIESRKIKTLDDITEQANRYIIIQNDFREHMSDELITSEIYNLTKKGCKDEYRARLIELVKKMRNENN
jgi:hypothetical protein